MPNVRLGGPVETVFTYGHSECNGKVSFENKFKWSIPDESVSQVVSDLVNALVSVTFPAHKSRINNCFESYIDDD